VKSSNLQFGIKAAALTAAVLLCPLAALAADGATPALHPGTPLVLEPVRGAFEFDLAGSDVRKLNLQLSQPLTLQTGHVLLAPTPGSNLLGLDAVLQLPLSNGIGLHAGAEQILGTTHFQSLGSIQCVNGVLGPDSYTASGCHFVTDGSPVFDRRTLNLGASREFGRLGAEVNLFTSESHSGAAGVNQLNHVTSSEVLANELLNPLAGGSALPGFLSDAYLANKTSGIDLNFQLGLATDQAGEIRLGLALTRVLDASYQGIGEQSLGPRDWRLASPFDTATLGIEWSKGSFSSGIRGYYREPVNFLDRGNLDSMSTFDVHFTWRAPWKANLSIGASNVLGAGVEDRNDMEKSTDRYESIYGRIPYVRYQQDL
jgi:hypothetical protein